MMAPAVPIISPLTGSRLWNIAVHSYVPAGSSTSRAARSILLPTGIALLWKIYTKGDIIRPQYVSGDAVVDRCIIGEGAEIYGEVHNSVIGADVRIEKGVVVRDSIIMRHSTIGEGTQVNKAIIAENVHVEQKKIKS